MIAKPQALQIPIKIAAPIIVPHVVIIINKSFDLGVYPNSLKLAKVGSKLEVNNNRGGGGIRLFSFLGL